MRVAPVFLVLLWITSAIGLAALCLDAFLHGPFGAGFVVAALSAVILGSLGYMVWDWE